MVEARSLGGQGLVTSAVGLGCMGMSQSYGPGDDDESIATIHRALELGCSFLDTAEAYGPFTNEELLGRALHGRRDDAVVATKFGWNFDENGTRGELNSHPDHIVAVVEASLRRLRTDHLDLLYQHRVDLTVPIEDVAGAVGELIAAGKVRFFGLSEAAPDTIRRAHATFPLSALQTEYSLWERDVEDGILPTLRELGIGLVPYSPLGRGFLTGTARPAEDQPEGDYRRFDPRFQGENFATNSAAAEEVRRVAARHDATPAQVALAWLLARGPDVVPIPGTKRRATLEENVAATELRLDPRDLAALDQARIARAAGLRYPEQVMGMNRR